MNRAPQGPTGLNVDDISAKVRSLLTDTDIATALSVVTPASTSLDAASGVLTRTSTTNVITGYFGPLSAREIEASSAYQEGDKRVCVMVGDLTVEPTVFSWVIVGNEKFAAVTVERDPLNVYREMVVRRTEQT